MARGQPSRSCSLVGNFDLGSRRAVWPMTALERTVRTKYHLDGDPYKTNLAASGLFRSIFVCHCGSHLIECRRKWSKTVHIKCPHSNFLAVKCDVQAAQSNTSSSLATIQRDHNVFLDWLKSKCLKNPQPQTNYRKHEYIEVHIQWILRALQFQTRTYIYIYTNYM